MKRAILVSVLLSGLALGALSVVLYTSKLHEELSRLRRENLELSQELGQVAQVSKKLDELLKSYDEIAPQVAGIQGEIDATRDYVSKIEALTPQGLNGRGRAELKLLIEEVIASERQRQREEAVQWADDLRERHLDELTSMAHLSPAQKKELAGLIREEQKQINGAYARFAQGLAREDDLRRAKEDARIERDRKVKELLAPDQYQKYAEWARQRDLYRAGINRRQQSTDTNQDDL